MSLLTTGRDTVQVYVEEETTDDYGNDLLTPSDTAVDLRCRVQPSTAEEAQQFGQQVGTVYRILSRTFPANAHGKVTWDGRDWDIIGDPRRHNGSERTRHVTTYIRARSSAPVA